MAFLNIRKQLFNPSTRLYLTGLALLSGAGMINSTLNRPVLNLSKQETAVNIQKDLLIFASAGNKRLFTDLLWVQTLIESDLEHYKKRDLNSWLFLRFNTIAALDPKFYQNYLYGGQFLAIVKDDLEGADTIYEKGIKHYPDDYALNYNAGFLNYYEIGNAQKGLQYLEKVQNHPKAPVFIKSIINKLKVASGVELNDIFPLVLHHYESTQDETLKKKLRGDLYAIKAEIDLKCLNENKSACDVKDLDGNFYVRDEKGYRAQKPFLLYRINKRGDDSSSPQQAKPIYR